LILYIFKGYILPFPPRSIGPEITGIFFYMIIQYIRLKIGSNGNKTETAVYLFYCTILGIPVIVSYVFYIQLQTYVLVFDVVLNATGIIFIIVETLLSIRAIINIKSHDKPI